MTSKLVWESRHGYRVFLVTTGNTAMPHHFSVGSLAGGSISPDEVLSMTAALTTAAFPLQKSLLKKRQLEHGAL
jgi:hypothetical protein